MGRFLFLFTLVIFIILFFTACPGNGNGNGNGTDTPIANPSFSTDIQPVFTASCVRAGCHNASAQAGLNLSSGAAFANLVNVPATQEAGQIRVIPLDANGSYLIVKLEGRQTIGSRMPLTGSISATQIQNIKNWINNGAPNN